MANTSPVTDNHVPFSQDYAISSSSQLITVEPLFSRDHFEISSWTTTPDGKGGQTYDPNSLIPNFNFKQLNLYAQWKKKSYTVDIISGASIPSIRLNGPAGQVIESGKSYEYQSTIYANAVKPSDTQWYYYEDPEMKINGIATSIPASFLLVENTLIEISCNTVLKKFSIAIEGNAIKDVRLDGSTGQIIESGQKFDYGTNIYINGSLPSDTSKKHYQDLVIKCNGETIDAGTTQLLLADMTISINCTEITKTYTVTFNLTNGGQCETKKKLVVCGDPIGELPIPTYAGHAFVGWFTTPDGNIQINESTTPTSNVTYYAQYMPTIIHLERIGNVVVDENLLASGFSADSYLKTVETINFADNIEFVFKAKSSYTTPNQKVFGMANSQSNLEFGCYLKKFMWEIVNGKTVEVGSMTANNDVFYYFKITKDTNQNYKCYISTDGISYTLDYEGTRTDSGNVVGQAVIGYDIDVTEEWWRGTIDLANSFIKINGYTITFSATQTHYVYFYSDGELKKTDTVEHGQNAYPPDISKPGYKLTGWEPSYNNITADTTCNAVWSQDTWDVTVKCNFTQNQPGTSSGTVNLRLNGETVGSASFSLSTTSGWGSIPSYVTFDLDISGVTKSDIANYKYTITDTYNVSTGHGDNYVRINGTNIPKET